MWQDVCEFRFRLSVFLPSLTYSPQSDDRLRNPQIRSKPVFSPGAVSCDAPGFFLLCFLVFSTSLLEPHSRVGVSETPKNVHPCTGSAVAIPGARRSATPTPPRDSAWQ